MSGNLRVWVMRGTTKVGQQTLPDVHWVARTTPVPPVAPWSFGKSAPTNAAGGLSENVTLSWGYVEGVSYDLCVNTVTSCPEPWDSLGLPMKYVDTLSPGTHYWQVRGNGNGNGATYADNGAWWSFTVTGGLGPQGGESVDDPTRVGRRTPGAAGTTKTKPPATSPAIGSGRLSTTAPVPGPPGPSMFPGGAPTAGQATASGIVQGQTSVEGSQGVNALTGVPEQWRLSLTAGAAVSPLPAAPLAAFPAEALSSEREVQNPGGATSQSLTLLLPVPWDDAEYYHVDALGSVRVVTDATGAVLRYHDYLPFGEEWPAQTTHPEPRLFTGKERDFETSLDYFGARYYRADLGRFTTIDPVTTIEKNLVDPQRWNRYTYVRNSPTRYTHPSGACIYPGQTAWSICSARAKR